MLAVEDTDNSPHSGRRGPTRMEDFQLREKLTRFDHERIPERSSTGAYCYFEAYESLTEYVRFSTCSPRGSADTVRDVRDFSTEFCTRYGNYDLIATTRRSSSSR